MGRSPVRCTGIGICCEKQITDDNSAQQDLNRKNPAVTKQDVATYLRRFMPGNLQVTTKTFRAVNPLPDSPLNLLCTLLDAYYVGSFRNSPTLNYWQLQLNPSSPLSPQIPSIR